MKQLLWLLLALALTACWGGDSSDEDDVDAGPDTDTDADVDTDNDTDADTDTSTIDYEGTWYDETTGLLWQEPPGSNAANAYHWQYAVAYCSALNLAGFDDWRLPTISELRSLIRECPPTELGGACGVTDSCLEMSCETGACYGCTLQGGPAIPHGCYFSPELYGDCMWFWWSQNDCSDSWPNAWGVDFMEGDVGASDKEIPSSARCVRGTMQDSS
jgi:hypothetical protein